MPGLLALVLLVGLSTLTSWPLSAGGEDDSPTTGATTRGDGPDDPVPREQADDRRRLLLFPADDLYPPILAGPHRRGFAVLRLRISDTTTPETGRRAFGLMLGGRFGLLRLHPEGRVQEGWQLGVETGFYGQFDIDNAYDNIGWDGFYGLVSTSRLGPVLALKVGVVHTSSHVGDEYAERTGRLRIGYTREELTVGLSWTLGARWRTYAEGGWAYELRNEILQEPGRLQAGAEYSASLGMRRDPFEWYAALDSSATEERDWQIDWALQVGLMHRRDDRRWRFGLEAYEGRAPLGEFFQDDQRYLALGLWLDL